MTSRTSSSSSTSDAVSSLTRRAAGFLDAMINRIFALNRTAAEIRFSALFVAIMLSWTFIGLKAHPIPPDATLWLGNLIIGSPGSSSTQNLMHLLGVVKDIYFSWDVLAHLIAMFIPAWFAFRVASTYLADVFEQKEISIAQNFISQAAFAQPEYWTIHVEDGRVRQNDQRTPVFRIGGPGLVQVNLENAAVFERIDGSHRIIGPTIQAPYNLRVLDGFERFRQAIDLRDLTLTLENLSERTRDGIQVNIPMVRLLFSVMRDTPYVTLTRPYPYSAQAVWSLVFDQSGSGPWTSALTGIVANELTTFISERSLGELLASIGDPEIRKQIEQDAAVQRQKWRSRRRTRHFAQPDAEKYLYPATRLRPRHTSHPKKPRPPRTFSPVSPMTSSVPVFTHRPQLTNRFYDDFVREFPTRAKRRGFRLEWIDVGTWKIPEEIIINQHLDALRLTNENLARGDRKVIEQLKFESRVEELAELVQKVPLMAHIAISQPGHRSSEQINSMIDYFLGILRNGRDDFRSEGRPIPAGLDTAIEQIEKYQRRQRGHVL